MLKILYRYSVLLVLLFLTVENLFSQSTEADLIKTANSFFEKEEYAKAMPLYSQLLSLHPSDPEYNYKYGASAIYGESVKKDEGVKYLKFACGKPGVSTLAYFFLGKVYHLNYQFNDAIIAYQSFKAKADNQLLQKYQIDQQISICENGKKLLQNIKDITVIDKVQTTVKDFFRNYELDEVGGRILVCPEELLSSIDKKNEFRPLIFFPGKTTTIYFSSYGNDKANGKDLYKAEILPGGKYSTPVKLNGPLNTNFDEDFPFMHSDGKTLYFCSKGHNSMGGFDVFKSILNNETDVFSQPENLDFAINTPDDDIFYIADSLNKVAFFASSRNSKQGDLEVFKVSVESISLNISLIQGQFLSETTSSDKLIKVNLIDGSNNKDLGNYVSSANGEYVLSFPKGGKYKYVVTLIQNGKTYNEIVDVPVSNSVMAYKQEIKIIQEGSFEKMVIVNHFDQPIEGDISALAQSILKQKAGLDINFDPTQPLASGKIETVFSDAGFSSNLSNKQIIENAQAKLNEKKVIELEMKKNSIASLSLANEKKNEALNKVSEAEALLKEIDQSPNNIENDKKLVKASFLKFEADNTIKESDSAYKLSYLLDSKMGETNLSAQKDSVDLINLSNALNSNSYSVALEQFKKQKEKEQKENSLGGKQQGDYELVRTLAIAKQSETNKNIDQTKQLREEEADLTNRIKVREKQLEDASKKEKPTFQLEINEYQQQLQSQKIAIKESYEKVEKLQLEANNLESQAEILKTLKEGKQLQNSKTITTETEKKNLKAAIANTEDRKNNLKINKEEVESILIKNPDYLNTVSSDNRKIAEFNNYSKSDIAQVNNGSNQNNPIKADPNQNVKKEEKNVEIAKVDSTNSEKIEKEKDWIKTLDSDIKNLEKEKEKSKKADKEKIQKKINDLKELKSRKEESIASLKNEENLETSKKSLTEEIAEPIKIVQADSLNTTKASGSDFSIANFDPEYQQRMVKLDESKNLSKEQINEKISLNKKLIEKIDNQIKSDNQLLLSAKSEVEKNEITKKINIETAVRQAKQSEMNSDNQQLNEFVNSDFVRENNIISTKIDSNYVTNYLAIDQEPLNEYEKTTKKAVADFAISKKIKEQIEKDVADLDITNSDAEKERLQNEVQLLQKLFSEKTKNASDLSFTAAQFSEAERNNKITDATIEESNISNDNQEIVEKNEEKENEEITPEEKFRLEHLPPDDFSVDLINQSDFDLNILFADLKYKSEEANDGANSSKEIVNELTADKESLNKLIIQYKNSVIAAEKENLRNAIYKKTISLNEKQLELAQNIFLSNQSELGFLNDENDKLKKVNINSNSPALVKADNLTSEAVRLKINAIEKLGSVDGDQPLADQNRIFKEALEMQNTSIEKFVEANKIYKSGVIDPNVPLKDIAVDKKDSTIKDVSMVDKMPEAIKTNDNLIDSTKSKNDIIQTPIIPIEESAIARKANDAINNSIVISEQREAEISITDERLNNYKKLESLSKPSQGIVESNFKNQPEVFEVIKRNESYLEYFKLKIANDSLKKISMTQNSLGESFGRLASIKVDQAKNIATGKVSSENGQKESDKLYNEAYFNYEKKSIALLNASKADSLSRLNSDNIEKRLKEFSEADRNTIKSIEENKYFVNKPAEIAIDERSDIQPEITSDLVAIQKPKEETIVNEVKTIIPVNAILPEVILEEKDILKIDSKNVPKILKNSIFKVDTLNKSNKDNVIQNPTLPQGLVFMVQVGAFKNPIAKGAFKSFSPVLTDKLKNGITRYIVGLFINVDDANNAKKEIRGMGYKDAFVVAYQDGKRIQMINSDVVPTIVAGENISNNTTKTDEKVTPENKVEQLVPIVENKVQSPKLSEIQVDQNFVPDTKAASYYSDPNAARAKQVEVVKGLFYTVQVGVYSKPVSADKLFNISPLNSELLSNSYIRYTSGQFNSLILASDKKDNIVSLGITDAFITAYYNGKRISVTQAQELINKNGNSILAGENNSKLINEILPVPNVKEETKKATTDTSSIFNTNKIDTQPKDDTVNTNINIQGFGNVLKDEGSDINVNESVEYKILLGEFDQNIPSEVASSLLNIQYLGVSIEPLENGKIRYTSNTVYFYKSASDLLKSFQEGGMTDAKIIAFIDKKPASIEDAKKLSGE